MTRIRHIKVCKIKHVKCENVLYKLDIKIQLCFVVEMSDVTFDPAGGVKFHTARGQILHIANKYNLKDFKYFKRSIIKLPFNNYLKKHI